MRCEARATQRGRPFRMARLGRGSQVKFYAIYLPSLVCLVTMGLAAAELL